MGSPFGLGIHPLAQHAFGAFGHPGLQQGLGGGASSLFGGQSQGVDPITVALLLQQSSPWGQSQMPIRPLINPQQLDPIQIGAMSGGIVGQGIDPYSALAQACLTSPMGVSPIHQALRQQVVSPWMTTAGIAC
jgi:hypothetical protein